MRRSRPGMSTRRRGLRALLAIAILGGLWGGPAATPATVAADQETILVSRGRNVAGQFGVDRHTYFSLEPVVSRGPAGSAALRNAAALAAGSWHTVVLRNDGGVLALGDNEYGQLGTGSAVRESDLPVFVAGLGGGDSLRGVTAVAAGSFHSVALRADGTVVAWGRNDHGQLGDGTRDDRRTPVAVKGVGGGVLTNVRAISAGTYTTVALRADGSVVAWGDNDHGQLGDGTTVERHTPVMVRGSEGQSFLGGIVAVAAGGKHTAALRGDGTVVAWGGNVAGQLGNGAPRDYPTQYDSATPVEVLAIGGEDPLRRVVAIDAGGGHTVALRDDGSVFAWGANSSGELGNRTVQNSNRATPVADLVGDGRLSGVVAISAGGDHTMALRADGTVLAWGTKSFEPFSTGVEYSDVRPVPILAVGGGGPLTGGVAIAAGGSHGALLITRPRPAACGRFGDVPTGDPACAAIEGLAARGVIRGCDQTASPPRYCPDDPTARAQMAALIARAMGWDAENHNTTFSDRCSAPEVCIDDALWRNVGTLQFYGVAKGYPDGTYNPFDNVLQAQVISFITRAMVKKGTWVAATQDRPSIYPPIPASSGHRLDLVTYVTYAGPVPGTTAERVSFPAWDQPATRAWFALALWQALNGNASPAGVSVGGDLP